MELREAYELVLADMRRRHDEGKAQNETFAKQLATAKRKQLRHAIKSYKAARAWERHLRHAVEHIEVACTLAGR